MEDKMENKYLRAYIKSIYDTARMFLGNQIIDENFYSSVVFRNICESKFENVYLNPIAANMSEEAKAEATLLQGLMEAVMLEDLYISLNKKHLFKAASKADEKILKRIIECANKKDFKSLFIDPSVGAQLIKASLGFLDSSAYDKVLSYKCLDVDDAIMLTSFSPLFTRDLKKYAVDINRDFLIRQINKWKINFTEEEAIYAAAKFLIEAFNMVINAEDLFIDIRNHAGTDDFIQALVDENLVLVSAFVLSYYKTYNQDAPKLK